MSPSDAAAAPIRVAELSDADEMARLLTILGHATAGSGIRQGWDAWRASDSSALVAGYAEQPLVGLATLHVAAMLHRPRPVGRITSLVVDTHARGQGIGRRLVAVAENLLTARGCGLLEVTSNMRRADAHAFYEGLGYERTSFRFSKTLND